MCVTLVDEMAVRTDADLKELIQTNAKLLLRCMDPSVELMIHLKSVSYLRQRGFSVQAHETTVLKIGRLLDMLQEVPDEECQSVKNGVIDALRESGQDHVAEVFCGNLDMVMSDGHYGTLKSKKAKLCQFLDPENGLLDEMESNLVVSDSDVQRIRLFSGYDDKARELVEIIMRKPDSAFKALTDALNKTGQRHVTYILTGEGDSRPLSDGHYGTLKAMKAELCQFLDPENGLLDVIESTIVISNRDVQRIRSFSGYNDKARELVETIMRKPDSAFKALIEALDKTGQKHVTYILTGEGKSRPLSVERRATLLKKRATVVNSIYPKCLVSSLISNGVFTTYDKDRVEGRTTDKEKGETMLDLIARKSEEAFVGFTETLQECHHEHVVVELMGPEVAAKVEVHVTAGADMDIDMETELRYKMQNGLQNNNTEVKQVNDFLASNGVAIIQVDHGSIIVKFRCRDHAALASLKHLYSSKQLDQLFTEAFRPQFADKGLESLSLDIPDEEFERNNQLKLIAEDHRETLLSSVEWLGDKITISDELLDKLSLCKSRRQAIERAATREEQVKTLLDIVSRQPDSAFTQFLNALISTDQHEAESHLCRWPHSSQCQDASE